MANPNNAGEKGELLLKAKALQCMRDGESVPAIPGKIHSLHLGDFKKSKGTYSDPTECPEIGDLNAYAKAKYADIQLRLSHSGIAKAGTSMKADIEINGTRYSIKSSEKKPAIINHTFRRGFIRITNKLNLSITPLDDEIEKYWTARMSNIYNIGEDISENDRRKHNIFFSSEFKEYFRPIFNYFAFIGTGKSDSPTPAEYILEFDNPLDPSTWKVLSKASFYDEVWPSLIFSVRSKVQKGQILKLTTMPESDRPWAVNCNGKIKSQLHVRAG